MTYGLILVKSKTGKKDLTLTTLADMMKKDLRAHPDTRIEKVFLSFGWPDFVLLIKAKNIEQIRYMISNIREKLASQGDYIETSTIICSTPDEMKEKRREWAELLRH